MGIHSQYGHPVAVNGKTPIQTRVPTKVGVMLNKQDLKTGIKNSLPICVAFLLCFSSLGLLAHAKNLSFIEATLLTATIFAGPSQTFVINNNDLSLWAVALNIIILNFKFILMSALIVPLWQKRKRLAIPALYFMCSSAYLVCSVKKDTKDPWSFYIGLVFTSYCIAVLATMIGYKAWDILTDTRTFLSALAHIVLPTHFICLTVKRKGELFALATTLLGIFLTPALTLLIGKHLLILAWFFLAFIAIHLEERLCGKS
jgi:predicted branched-subunit amino acid permease